MKWRARFRKRLRAALRAALGGWRGVLPGDPQWNKHSYFTSDAEVVTVSAVVSQQLLRDGSAAHLIARDVHKRVLKAAQARTAELRGT